MSHAIRRIYGQRLWAVNVDIVHFWMDHDAVALSARVFGL